MAEEAWVQGSKAAERLETTKARLEGLTEDDLRGAAPVIVSPDLEENAQRKRLGGIRIVRLAELDAALRP